MEQREYVLRRRNSAGEDEYVPVHVFTVEQYRCGLRAGDQLQLRRPLATDGPEREVGCVWTVLTGSLQDPVRRGSASRMGSFTAGMTTSPSSSTSRSSPTSNFPVEQPAGSHSLAVAAHRDR